MSLVERGAVKLDVPVGRYLSEFRKPAFAQVTIQRLLTHTAGFPAIPPPGVVQDVDRQPVAPLAFPRRCRIGARGGLMTASVI